MEVYGLGIDRVPKSWVKDSEWGGSKEAVRKRERSKQKEEFRTGKKGEEGDVPSWRWKQPSMWKAEKERMEVTKGRRGLGRKSELRGTACSRRRHGIR